MKSPIISRGSRKHRGFLLAEIMLAFSLMVILLGSAIVLSVTSKSLHEDARTRLEYMTFAFNNFASTTLHTTTQYGNDTIKTTLEPLEELRSNFQNAWGRDSCLPRAEFSLASSTLYSTGVSLGTSNISTDIEVRDKIAYLTADSNLSSAHDLFIIDLTYPSLPTVISSISTGPGLGALEVAGPYIYAANLGTTNQLQVIDITNRSQPNVVVRYKLPLPEASTTPPFATAIFYSRGFIYLGTEKWDGNEFNIIDVRIPTAPVYLGGFETNTQVNSIYVRDGYAYVAASDMSQMRILNVQNPAQIQMTASFSPSGWETQQGRIVSYFEGAVSLGRNTGGFNVIGNHEVFAFATTSPFSTEILASKDVPGGVYGIIKRPAGWLLATKSVGYELQLWDQNFSEKIREINLGFQPTSFVCDKNTLYFSTGNDRGVATLLTD